MYNIFENNAIYVVTYFKFFIISDLIHTSSIFTVHEYKKPLPDEDILRVMALLSRKNIGCTQNLTTMKLKMSYF